MNQNTPNLFILGVAKSGTTTLADALRQCPQIYVPSIKEPTYFSSDINYMNGMDWYIRNFYQNPAPFLYRCDASPSYFYFHQKVSKRIRSDLGNQKNKFILIFRNPVDRAYSHYWHNVYRGLREDLSFENALLAEEERLQTQQKELNDLGRIRYAYFRAGLYAEQLRTFWTTFPREDFMLFFQEDLRPERFAATLYQVQDFLQIPRLGVEYQHSNPAYKLVSRRFSRMIQRPSLVKSILKPIFSQQKRTQIKSSLLRLNINSAAYQPMKPETRRMLLEQYAAPIREFEELIGRDLSSWLK